MAHLLTIVLDGRDYVAQDADGSELARVTPSPLIESSSEMADAMRPMIIAAIDESVRRNL